MHWGDSISVCEEGFALLATGTWRADVAHLLHLTPWPLMMMLIALAVAVRDRGSAVIATLLACYALVDLRAAVGGIMLGQAIGAGACFVRGRALKKRTIKPRLIGGAESARTARGWRRMLFRRPIRTALATRFVPSEHTLAFMAAGIRKRFPWAFVASSVLAWTLWAAFYAGVTLAVAALVIDPLVWAIDWPWAGLGVPAAIYVPRVLALCLTRHGRRRLRTRLWRMSHREFWPSSVLYAPLVPYLCYLSARVGGRKGAMVFTCCNPGIEAGGGIIGESKKAILDALAGAAGPAVPASVLIPAGEPGARAALALELMGRTPGLERFPIVLKPDTGFRGYAFRLCRSAADIREYLAQMTGPAIMQTYHPGPYECGILWARRPEGRARRGRGGGLGEGAGGRAGFIYSITRKDFPYLVGDGVKTLEELIYAHPRYHAQAATFLERWAGERERVLAAGERVRLAESGNHCQGTLFRDGSDLITPALEDAIDRIARGYQPAASGATRAGAQLDIGRFDVRYESDEALRRGEGFSIIEFNGTAGESTNIYDPERSIFWMYRVLAGQWRLMYELGAARRREGAKPLSLLEILRGTRAYNRERTGSALAD